jgi:hypothetical protein
LPWSGNCGEPAGTPGNRPGGTRVAHGHFDYSLANSRSKASATR